MRSETISPGQERDLYRHDYVARFQRIHRGQRRLSGIVRRIDVGPLMEVADLGCGDGRLLALVHERIAHYHGVDFSSEFIAEARRRQAEAGIANATFYCEPIVEFCERHAARFDRIFALDFTEHVRDEELAPILKAARGSLRRDGLLYVHTPNRRFFLEVLKDKGILPQVTGHIAVRSAEQYVALMKAAGFGHVVVRYLPHYLPVMAGLHRFSRLPLVGERLRARLMLECQPSAEDDQKYGKKA